MTGLSGKILSAVFIFAILCGSAAAGVLMPFVLAGTSSGDVATVSAEVRSKLSAGGFSVIGEYSPYADANIIVVTSNDQKNHAAKSEFGGYGAITRIGITRNGDSTEVAYTNPVYMAAAYRMAVDMTDVRDQLEQTLGARKEFGSRKDLTAEDLREYRYTVLMDYFDQPSMLAKYASHEAAVMAVEDSLATGVGGTTRIYRVDIPGKKETVFGVALYGVDADDCSSDEFIMSRIDRDTPRSSPHLPYELLVTNGVVRALQASFRIAINWPHLPMVASETGATYMSIICAESAIEEALSRVAGKVP